MKSKPAFFISSKRYIFLCLARHLDAGHFSLLQFRSAG